MEVRLAVHELPIVIVGTGFSGIAMGAMLKRAGIESFTAQKADDVGGTWRENTTRARIALDPYLSRYGCPYMTRRSRSPTRC